MMPAMMTMAVMAALFVLFGLMRNDEEGCEGHCQGCVGACDNETEGRSA